MFDKKDTVRILLKSEFEYPTEVVSRVLSGKQNLSDYVESGIRHYLKTEKILNNLKGCGAKQEIKKFDEVVDTLKYIEEPKKIVKTAKEKGFISEPYTKEINIKKMLNISTTRPFYVKKDRIHIKRAATAVRYAVYYLAVQNIVLEMMGSKSCKNKILS